jgi:hypothetical protein
VNRTPNPFDQPQSPAATADEVKKFMTEKPNHSDGDSIPFPQTAIAGSVGELAHELADGTEVPEEFFFAAALTVIGSLCAGRLHLAVNLECETRLYTVLLGASSDVKKSTAQRRTIKTLLPLLLGRVEVLYGIGSAEGLARVLADKSHVLLCYDEMKSLFDKCRIEGSSLLAMTASFYENNRWSNPTKDAKQSIQVSDGHLGMLACCTIDTYSNMWSAEAISIGLANRLFVVSSDRKRKVAWPKEPDLDRIERIVKRIQGQLDTLPKTLGITPEAKHRWSEWYLNLGSGVHSKRLDALGFRLMQLLALTADRQVIDLQTIDAVLAILDYEHQVRLLTDPIDAESVVARVEERIRRALRAKGASNRRQLQRAVSANRVGLWAFETAIANLRHAEQIHYDTTLQIYSAVPEDPDAL